MSKTTKTSEAVSASRPPPTGGFKSAKAPPNIANDTVKHPTRASILIELMLTETGETARRLAEAVGWQVHSVRGFICGTLKKRTDLKVVTTKVDGVTRYTVRDAVEAVND